MKIEAEDSQTGLKPPPVFSHRELLDFLNILIKDPKILNHDNPDIRPCQYLDL
jgi:hypothetical protein